MKPTFYVATRLENAPQAAMLISFLKGIGWKHTYDWTLHGSVQSEGVERMREVARAEMHGVYQADIMIVLLPGGRGTHTELGAAICNRRGYLFFPKIIVYAPSEDALHTGDGAHCCFYHHPAVELIVGDWSVLIDRVLALDSAA